MTDLQMLPTHELNLQFALCPIEIQCRKAQHKSQAGHAVVRSCDKNSDSSATRYVNLNLIGIGKTKLAHVNYTFDPDEL